MCLQIQWHHTRWSLFPEMGCFKLRLEANGSLTAGFAYAWFRCMVPTLNFGRVPSWLAQNSALRVTGSSRTRLGVTSGSPGSPRTRLGVTSGSPGSPRTLLGVTSGSLRGHLARENSARSHFELEKTWLQVSRTSRKLDTSGFEAIWLKKTGGLAVGATWLSQTSARGHFGVTGLAQNSARGHFGATSEPPGSPRTRLGVTSGSLRDDLAQENSARGHFGVTWLKKARIELTSRSLGSGKLGWKSLRSHLARENSARSHCRAASRCHFKVTSKSLGSRKLESRSFQNFEAMQKNYSGKLSRCH
jgi:hypothetical protein